MIFNSIVSYFVVFIVSSPSISGENCHSEKCEWIKEHLGESWARSLVLTKDKTIVMGRVLIDDKPYITGTVSTPTWDHVLFSQPYNVQLPDSDQKVYLHDWKDWKLTIEKFVLEDDKHEQHN